MSNADLVIKNCNVVTPEFTFYGWVAIQEGKIVALGDGSSGPAAKEVVDGADRYLLPGRVEPHIHLGVHYPFEDDVEQTSAAALAGGTTVMMPYNRTKASYLDVYPKWEQTIAQRSFCDVVIHLQIQSRQHIDEIRTYRQKFGVLNYKLHLDYRAKEVAELPIAPLDDGDVYLTMQQCAFFNGIVSLHCEDVEIVRYTLPAMRATGRTDLQAWSDGRPAFCEVADIHTTAYLAEVTGSRVLVLHMSTADGIEAAAKWTKRPPLLETLVQFLTVFPEEAGDRIGPIGKMNPPLRSRANADLLWAGIRRGQILIVGTDHIACDKHETDDLWSVTAGMPGIETALPLLLSEGVHQNRITLQQLVQVACLNPARLYAIDDRKGSIAVGKDADLVLVNMNEERVVSPDTTYSKLKTSANGMTVKGWPCMTIKGGHVAFDSGRIVAQPGLGRVLRSY
jgi:dihydroorotase-like cyclic amidohydrolase